MANTHRPEKPVHNVDKTHSVSWPAYKPVEEWLKTQPKESWKPHWEEKGYLVVEGLLEPEELKVYQDIYNKFLRGDIDATRHRHDLGNHKEKQSDVENICQIMWPSLYVDKLDKGPLHERALAICSEILGPDAAFDFEMMLSKAPHTNTITPWHQDESYWPEMPDATGASVWLALDDVDVDNGCMWFIPGSHKLPLRTHAPAAPGVHVLVCPGTEEGVAVPVSAGSCTIHSNRTLHYTRGNTTDRHRRAYTTVFRPATMVEFERNANYDHGKKDGVHVITEMGVAHEGHE